MAETEAKKSKARVSDLTTEKQLETTVGKEAGVPATASDVAQKTAILKESGAIPITGSADGMGGGLAGVALGDIPTVTADQVGGGQLLAYAKKLNELKKEAVNLETDEEKLANKAAIQYVQGKITNFVKADESQKAFMNIVEQERLRILAELQDPAKTMGAADLSKLAAYNSYLQSASKSETAEAHQNASNNLRDALAMIEKMRNEINVEPTLLQSPKDVLKKQAIATAAAQGVSLLAGLLGGDITTGARGAVKAGEVGADMILAREAEINALNKARYETYMKARTAGIKDYMDNITGILKQHLSNQSDIDKKRIEEVSNIWEAEQKAKNDVLQRQLDQRRANVDTRLSEGRLTIEGYKAEIENINKQKEAVKSYYAVQAGDKDRILDADKKNADNTRMVMQSNARIASQSNRKRKDLNLSEYKHAWMMLPSLGVVSEAFVDLASNPATAGSMSNAITKSTKLTSGYENLFFDNRYNLSRASEDRAVLDRVYNMRKHLIDIYNFAQNNDKAVQFNGNANIMESLSTDIDNAVYEGKTLDQAIFQVSSLRQGGVTVKDLGTREEKIAYMNSIAGMIERISRGIQAADASRNELMFLKGEPISASVLDAAVDMYTKGNRQDAIDYFRRKGPREKGKGRMSEEAAREAIEKRVENLRKAGG